MFFSSFFAGIRIETEPVRVFWGETRSSGARASSDNERKPAVNPYGQGGGKIKQNESFHRPANLNEWYDPVKKKYGLDAPWNEIPIERVNRK